MPRLTENWKDLNPGDPSRDSVVLAQSSGWGDKTIQSVEPATYDRDGSRTGGHFHKKQPLTVSADLRQSRALVDLMYKLGHSGAVRSRVGPETVEGGITFAFSGDAMLLPLQLIAQDKNPTFVHLGRLLGNPIDVVAASGDLTSTLTVADNLSTQTQALELKVTLSSASKMTTSSVSSTTVAADTVINSRQYKGDGGSVTGKGTGNQLFLITSAGAASKFQISDGNVDYADTTVADALGSTGKFLGTITGAEIGSTAVISDTTAKAYFDADPSRYDSGNTYYYYDGTDLKTVTYVPVAKAATLTFVGNGTDGKELTEVLSYKETIDFSKVKATKKAFAKITSAIPAGFAAGTVHITATPYTLRSTTEFPAVVTIAKAASVAKDGELAYKDDLRTTENPVKIIVTPGPAARVREGETAAKFTITGLDQKNDEIEQTLRFTKRGQLDAKKSLASFTEITNIQHSGFATGSMVTITAQDKATEVTITPDDDTIDLFVDAEMKKAGVPFTYRSLLFEALTIAINRGDPIGAVVTALGHSVDTYKNIAGGTEPSDISDLDRDDPNIFIGYEAKLSVGGVRLPMTGLTLSIVNGFAYSGAMGGKPEEEVKPHRPGKRSVMGEGDVIFTKENNLAQDFNDNVTYEEVVLEWEYTDGGAFPYNVRVEIDEAQLAQVGDPTSPGSGMTTLPMGIRAFSTSTGEPTDYRFVVKVQDPEFLRRYDIAA